MIRRNETLQKEIGNIIRHLMQLRGISQGKLAKLSGVSQGTICMNLKGERGWSIDVLNPICKALFITIGELLQRAEIAEEKAQLKARWMELRKMEEELEA